MLQIRNKIHLLKLHHCSTLILEKCSLRTFSVWKYIYNELKNLKRLAQIRPHVIHQYVLVSKKLYFWIEIKIPVLSNFFFRIRNQFFLFVSCSDDREEMQRALDYLCDCINQGCGSGSELDQDSIGSVDPDPGKNDPQHSLADRHNLLN